MTRKAEKYQPEMIAETVARGVRTAIKLGLPLNVTNLHNLAEDVWIELVDKLNQAELEAVNNARLGGHGTERELRARAHARTNQRWAEIYDHLEYYAGELYDMNNQADRDRLHALLDADLMLKRHQVENMLADVEAIKDEVPF